MSKSGRRQRDAVLGHPVDQHADQVGAVAALALAARSARPYSKTSSAAGERNGRCLYFVALRSRRRCVGVVGVGVADHLVAPGDQLRGVLRGYVEQPGQHLDREVGADLLDEVELLLLRGPRRPSRLVSPRRKSS